MDSSCQIGGGSDGWSVCNLSNIHWACLEDTNVASLKRKSGAISIAKMGVVTLFAAYNAKATWKRNMSSGGDTHHHQQQHLQRKRFNQNHEHLILSIYVFVPLSLPISPSQCLYIYLSIYQSVYLSIYLSIYLSFFLSLLSTYSSPLDRKSVV